MKKTLLLVALVAIFGCVKTKVEVATPKPVKIDINMRVDIYQHVVKDVDDIEDQIYGGQERQLNYLFALPSVYAAEYPEEVTLAIQRRRARAETIEGYFQSGYIGEDREALLQLIEGNVPSDIRAEVADVIAQENSDRETIYEATAVKNGVPVSETRKVFFQNHYNRAPSGYLFEIYDESRGEYLWKKK